MHVQSPALRTPTSRRGPAIAAISAIALAAGAAGGIVLATNGDDTSSSAVTPVPAKVAPSSPNRVWDGSPILRGTATPVAPSVANTAAAGKVAGYPRRPEGFHRLP